MSVQPITQGGTQRSELGTLVLPPLWYAFDSGGIDIEVREGRAGGPSQSETEMTSLPRT